MFKQVYYNLCRKNSTIKEQWVKGSNLHRHHIIPKHSGGLDEDTNFTYLTIREHLIAHYLLWKIYKNPNDLRSMHMLGCNLTYHQRKIVGEWCRDNNIGFHGASLKDKTEWRKKGIKTQIDNQIGIHNPENFKKFASLGGKAGSKSQMQSGTAIFDESKRSQYASLGGKALTGMICVTNGKHRTRIKPEKLDEYLNNGYTQGFKLFS